MPFFCKFDIKDKMRFGISTKIKLYPLTFSDNIDILKA